MKNKNTEQNKSVLIEQVINTLTRDELRALATQFGVPVGKSKENTITNLMEAIQNGKARVKLMVYVGHPPVQGQKYGQFIFAKKFRSYKEDKIVIPLPKVVVPADPVDPKQG